MKKPLRKPVKKKPVKPRRPSRDFDAIEFKVDRLFKGVQLTHDMVRDLVAVPTHGAFHDFQRVVDQMGRSLSTQIHLLAKELPPNKHDALAMKLDQLERRIALLEREATYTVRHVIDKQREEDPCSSTDSTSKPPNGPTS